ncbi:MAG: hypothetical protein Q9M13_09060, partial [Mariprofundales bacterium]|nr:hypothetical protein [Mariprofundales bacterium]
GSSPHHLPRHAGLDPASIFPTNRCAQRDGLRVKPAMTVCRVSPPHHLPRHAGLDPASIPSSCRTRSGIHLPN